MARGAGGKIVNRQELAEFLGVSLPTINAWVKQKMPYLQKGARGRDWQFDTAAIVQWRSDLASEQNEERLNLDQIEEETARVKLEQEKLKYARAAQLVVPLEQMERRLAVVFAEVRTAMRNIPNRIVSELIGETDETRFMERLSHEIDGALFSLSDFDTNSLDESLDGPSEP